MRRLFSTESRLSRSVCRSGCIRTGGKEEDGEVVEVEREVEENQGDDTCATWREDDRLKLSQCGVTHDQ